MFCLQACCGNLVRGADPAAANHPNLLLNRREIEAVKEEIRTQPWAAGLFEKLKAAVDGLDMDRHDGPRNAALLYVLTGEKQYADRVRTSLVNEARAYAPRFEKVNLKVERNSRGFNWEVTVTGASSADEALTILKDAEAKLAAQYGATVTA